MPSQCDSSEMFEVDGQVLPGGAERRTLQQGVLGGAKASRPPTQRKGRRRAPPNGGCLDPRMQCPLGAKQLQQRPRSKKDSLAPLGLCGPSELKHSLRRQRMEMVAEPQLSLPPRTQAGLRNGPDSVAEVLRAKLRYLTHSAGAEVLRPCVGCADLRAPKPCELEIVIVKSKCRCTCVEVSWRCMAQKAKSSTWNWIA